MNYWLFSIPLISAFIGWFTNYLAIKMMFHPRLPVRFAGITIQGIFPKRQEQFALKLGKLVSDELLSFRDIETRITNPRNLDEVLPVIEGHIDEFLRVKLSKSMPVVSMFIGDKTVNQLKGIFMEELQIILPEVMKSYMDKLRSELDLELIVVEKVKAFSSDKLESILFQIMAREFRFIEIIGGVLGFLIGLLQILITYLTT